MNNVSNSCWGAGGSNPFLGRGDGDAERWAACPWARAVADRAGPGRGLLTSTSITVTSAIRKMCKSSPLGGVGVSVLRRALPPEAGPSLTVGLPHPSPGWVSCSGLMAEGSQQQASLGLARVEDAPEQRSAGRVPMDLKGSGPACDRPQSFLLLITQGTRHKQSLTSTRSQLQGPGQHRPRGGA